MADAVATWTEVMPQVKNAVTGVGLWTALNQSQAITIENGQFVIGVPQEAGDLAGHLRMQSTRILIEKYLAQKLGQTIQLRVIEGTDPQAWELVKRKDEEARRLQEAAIQKTKAEVQARSTWDSVYDQISRHYASFTNKTLPQNRAKFLADALDIVVAGLRAHPVVDDLSERNYARCIERVAQYADIPSTMVAYLLDQRTQNG